ncbi:MAG: ribonuclease HI family protein [Abditibacteriales bacterium]|nr:ribonuclease HI family protein [Abditibacteriales bacterium]MDW8366407.1 ribonuclease HI family protein [Abditibacteriales bacterium]
MPCILASPHPIMPDHTPHDLLTIHFDGAAQGNPGPAGIGVVILDADGTSLAEIGEYIGEATNNVAEYRALIRALEEAQALGGRRLTIYADSELIVRQLAGQYEVKSPRLQPLFARVDELLRQFEQVHVTHIRRAANNLADKLATNAIKAAQKSQALL